MKPPRASASGAACSLLIKLRCLPGSLELTLKLIWGWSSWSSCRWTRGSSHHTRTTPGRTVSPRRRLQLAALRRSKCSAPPYPPPLPSSCSIKWCLQHLSHSCTHHRRGSLSLWGWSGPPKAWLHTCRSLGVWCRSSLPRNWVCPSQWFLCSWANSW